MKALKPKGPSPNLPPHLGHPYNSEMWTPASGTERLVTEFGPEYTLELLTALLTEAVPPAALTVPPFSTVLQHIGNANATTFFADDVLMQHAYRARAWAARALTYLGDENAIPWLIEALDDPHWRVRMNTLQALGRLGAEGYDEVLAKRLEDEHERVRCAAALALGRTGHEFALTPLQEALEDRSEAVRQQADHALARIEKRIKSWS